MNVKDYQYNYIFIIYVGIILIIYFLSVLKYNIACYFNFFRKSDDHCEW